MKQRNMAIDGIKGLAIIAIAFYHFGGGFLPYGYLGVDIFLVISGYLFVKQITAQITQNEFHYFSFITKKILRLWPIIIVAIISSLIIGYFLMLPDDYENLAESAIASSVFANNILQCITTKNYWDIVNLYKPLMHLWYVGLLMQAYIIFPFFYIIAAKIVENNKKAMMIIKT